MVSAGILDLYPALLFVALVSSMYNWYDRPPTPPQRRKAYVQCDWIASPAAGDQYDEECGARYQQLLQDLRDRGIDNVATWSTASTTEGSKERDPQAHVKRNCAQVDSCDMVITLWIRPDPPFKHWGSIAIIAYALGRTGIPCYVIGPDDCVAWRNHMMRHPDVKRIQGVEEI